MLLPRCHGRRPAQLVQPGGESTASGATTTLLLIWPQCCQRAICGAQCVTQCIRAPVCPIRGSMMCAADTHHRPTPMLLATYSGPKPTMRPRQARVPRLVRTCTCGNSRQLVTHTTAAAHQKGYRPDAVAAACALKAHVQDLSQAPGVGGLVTPHHNKGRGRGGCTSEHP
jgi:hypothetical protein